MSGNWAWRIPSLLQCFPSLLQVVFVLWVLFLSLHILHSTRWQ
jgi:hypothetical protein